MYGRRVAQFRVNGVCLGKVFVASISADRDDATHPGPLRCQQPVAAVFDHHAFCGGQPQSLRREFVNLGVRFLSRHDVTGEDCGEPSVTRFTEQTLDNQRYRAFIRSGADGQCQSRRDCFIDQPGNSGPQRQLSVPDNLHEDIGLGPVQIPDECIAVVDANGPVRIVEVLAHALFAARDLQQLTIRLDTPLDPQVSSGERAIERHTVAVTFGVDENAVAVE